MNSQSSSAAAGRRHTGPNLGMVATVYVLPKIASVFPVSAFGSKPPFFPGLNAPTEAVVSYFSTRAHAVLICAFLQLGARQSRSAFSPPPLPAGCIFLV
jgi:hypothetical protein